MVGRLFDRTDYNATMECANLAALRQEASVVFKDLTQRRRRARQYAAADAGQERIASALVRRGDFEAYLQRRLARSTARIEAHLLTHRCQA
jgi:hypothetical protein